MVEGTARLLFIDVMMGPLGVVAWVGGLLIAPAALLGARACHALGAISAGTMAAASAAAMVLYLLLLVWMTAFYGVPLFFPNDDLAFHAWALLFVLAAVPALLMVTPIRVIRRYLLTGSVGAP